MFDFGLNLKELRLKKGYTQENVAHMLNVNRSTIAGYEQNITNPSLNVLAKMAHVYGVTTDYLLGLNKHEMIIIDDLSKSQKAIIENLIAEFRKK